MDIQQFKYSPHPYYLPEFLNVFTWSMPFLAEKVTKMFYDLLSKTDITNERVSVNIHQMTKEKKEKDIKILRNKIKFVSKIAKMQKTLREESENIIKIKNMYGNKLPKGLLLEGKRAFEAFRYVKELDKLNESRPT